MAKILRYVLALVKTVVEGVTIEGDAIVVSVRPHRRGQLRCPICGRRCECHDHEPTRRWRAMDLARSKCFLEYGPARVTCPEHGVRVERVPWARHGSRYTRDFEDWVACLAVRCCMSAVSRIARVEWHSVGGICGRVYDEIEAQRGVGRFDGLRRIGIDETSYKKGHKYLTVVVDHDRGCLVWAHEGYGKEVLGLFLDEPVAGPPRRMALPPRSWGAVGEHLGDPSRERAGRGLRPLGCQRRRGRQVLHARVLRNGVAADTERAGDLGRPGSVGVHSSDTLSYAEGHGHSSFPPPGGWSWMSVPPGELWVMAVPLVPGPGLGDANAARKSMSTLLKNKFHFLSSGHIA